MVMEVGVGNFGSLREISNNKLEFLYLMKFYETLDFNTYNVT